LFVPLLIQQLPLFSLVSTTLLKRSVGKVTNEKKWINELNNDKIIMRIVTANESIKGGIGIER